MARKRTVRFSTTQRRLIGEENLKKMKELGLEIKTKQRDIGDQRKDVENRRRPLPPVMYSSGASCPVCRRVFEAKGTSQEEVWNETESYAILHLVQDHGWKGSQVNEWLDWRRPGRKKNAGEEKLQEGSSGDSSWQDSIMDPPSV